MQDEKKLRQQIEAAYDFRGHVTITFKSGESAEGYMFNRQYENPKLPEDNFIEVVLKGSGEKRRYSIGTLSAVALTGEDCAAGKSYEDYLKKKGASQ